LLEQIDGDAIAAASNRLDERQITSTTMRRTIRLLQDQPKPRAITRIASGSLCALRQNVIGHLERFVLDAGYAPATPAIRETTAM